MPLVEIIHASSHPTSREQKRELAREITEVFRDVLQTPDGRLRVFYQQIEAEDYLPDLLVEDGDSEDT